MVKLFKQVIVGDRGRLMALIVIMITITGVITITTLALLYGRFIQNQSEQLVTLVKSQARLVESVAAFDAQFSKQDNPEGSRGATLSQIREAHNLWKGFGNSGEFMMASLDGGKIKFLLPPRFDSESLNINDNRLGSSFFEPMQHALRGDSGAMIGLDYRGVKVLAAFEPVSVLNVGLVAKIDINEVREPFIKTGVVATSIALVLITLGTILFRRITNPLINKLELQVQEQETIIEQRTRELTRSERNFRSMVETIPGTVYQCLNDKNWTMKYISNDIEALCGYPPSDFIDNRIRTFASIIHGEDFRYVSETVNAAIANRKPYSLEYRVFHADGSIRWVYEKGMGVFDAGGNLEVLDGTLLDISDRKKAEDELAGSERQFRSLLDATPDAIIIVDADGKIVIVNAQVHKLFQYGPDELPGKSVEMLIPQQFRDGHFTLRRDYMLRPKARMMGADKELFALRKDGSQFAADINLSPIDTPQGLWIISSIRDVTERKAAERELQISEQRLGLAISAGQFTPWEYSINDSLIQTFTFYEQILGYGQGEMDDTMQTWLSVVHPEDRQLIQDAFIDYINSDKKEFRLNYRAFTKDGQERWIECVGTITDRDVDGRTVKITGMQHDITEQRRSEEIIAEKIRELEMFNRLAVGRELRMVELKSEINDLLSQSGETEKYKIVE